ncbi:Dihydroorotate dehydrogenase B (NAD(+)) electron transfer subunit, partial [termite gut metagenome]
MKRQNELWFLIQLVGDRTKSLGQSEPGDIINAILPLGNGFSMPQSPSEKLLLVGGGAGMAPMLFLGKQLSEAGYKPTFLLGMRNKKDLFLLDKFALY